jgi:hypothetical protein
MKNLINTLLFGRDKFSFMIALGIVCAIALGCSCGKDFDLSNIGKESNTTHTSSNSDNPFSKGSEEDIPSQSELESLVKGTTEDFQKAIDTNDFSEMRGNASSDFQSQFSEQQMEDAFKTYVNNKSIVLPVLKNALSSTPTFSPAPSFRTEKGLNILVISGQFPSKPRVLKFETEYINRGGEWKLLKYVVNM